MSRLSHTKIDPSSRVPIFEQIKYLIRFRIASGAYAGGGQLPPVLGFSKQLGVNLNTVAKAYRDLELAGVIVMRRGSGSFVREDAVERCRQALFDDIFGRLHEILHDASAAGIPKTQLNAVVRTALEGLRSPAPTNGKAVPLPLLR